MWWWPFPSWHSWRPPEPRWGPSPGNSPAPAKKSKFEKLKYHYHLDLLLTFSSSLWYCLLEKGATIFLLLPIQPHLSETLLDQLECHILPRLWVVSQHQHSVLPGHAINNSYENLAHSILIFLCLCKTINLKNLYFKSITIKVVVRAKKCGRGLRTIGRIHLLAVWTTWPRTCFPTVSWRRNSLASQAYGSSSVAAWEGVGRRPDKSGLTSIGSDKMKKARQ